MAEGAPKARELARKKDMMLRALLVAAVCAGVCARAWRHGHLAKFECGRELGAVAR